jgi:phospholipid/cholesterol/gamma-HCH transport system substrate-binding protein
MNYSKSMEIGVGLFAIAGLVALLLLAFKASNLTELADDDGYQLTAQFDNVGGLKVRSPVTISGVRVGRIAEIKYDNDKLAAVVKLSVSHKYNKIPVDSSASIFTSGLLGEQYLAIEPGGSDQYLVQSDIIDITQSALVLEQLIGQFMVRSAANGSQ